MTNLPDPKWKDGPPEGKEVVLVFEVRVTVNDDEDAAGEIEHEIDVALGGYDYTVQHTGAEGA